MDYKILLSKTKGLSVLLVEDYIPFRNDMAEIFDDLFESVTVASDGSEALSLYHNHYTVHHKHFDLVITDIQMPVMNGVELSEALLGINTDQQIIVLSSHTDSEYLLKLINMGVSRFITKPIDYKGLMDTLYSVSKKLNTLEVKVENGVLVNLGKNYTWDKEKFLLKEGNTIVDLTRHELIIMQMLVKKTNQVCTNEDIVRELDAQHIDISEKSIRNLVSKLRKKLPEKLISSMYGRGYSLTSISSPA